MMKTTLSLFTLVLILFVSCSDSKKSAQEALLDKVMAVHDEIMPKMGAIMKDKKQLKAKIEELSSDEASNAAEIDILQKAVKDLDNAHDEMMDWMHGFDRNFEGMVEDEVMVYLKDQMIKIEKVGQITNTALKNAEELLAE